MSPEKEIIECQLAIIGCGLSGMTAALFAAEQGIATVQTGVSGGMIFASGLMDLMGVHPLETGNKWRDPWAAIEALTRDIPDHPYARLEKDVLRESMEQVVAFLGDEGLPYLKDGENNSEMITPLGTFKHTYYVSQTMWDGVKALKEKPPCLILGFNGLNDFSASQITGTLRDQWPGLRWHNLQFSDRGSVAGLVSGDIMARDMELPENLDRLVKEVRPQLKDAEAVGMPAVLGMERSHEIVEKLSRALGARVFEIPTMPLSVPGLRLNEAFTRGLTARGVKLFFPSRVIKWEQDEEGNFLLGIDGKRADRWIRAEGVILAAGRFWAKGLRADRDKIRETLFDFPVFQPGGRKEWHRRDFFDLRGHSANRVGIEVDNLCRPIGEDGGPVFDNLFACGSILAHQDWMRMKCGSGLAIGTASAAVDAFSSFIA